MIKEQFVDYIRKSIIENWDLTAVQDYDNRDGALTYGQMGDRITKLHQLFEECGIQKDDKIIVTGKNSVNWVTVYLATISYGAIIVPLLQDFAIKDLYTLTNHSDARLMFVSSNIYKKMDVVNFDKIETIFNLDDFSVFHNNVNTNPVLRLAAPAISRNKFSLPDIPNSHIGVILYTSGTSGTPKGVMLNLNVIAANIRYSIENMWLTKGDNVVSFLPLAHCYGIAFEFLYPFIMGCKIVFLGKLPSPQIILKAFNEYKPRLILSVPLVIEKIYKTKIKPTLEKPMIKFFIKLPLFKGIIYKKIRKSLSNAFGGNFIEVIIGGAKMNREVEKFLTRIKFHFTIGYGMTECGPLVGYVSWKDRRIFSAGKVVDCLEARVNADQGKIGEILLRGENIMSGYYKNPEETAKALPGDGWLHTGDLGTIDKNNEIFLKGRNKNMILTATGQNIYPEEIEARFYEQPMVGECLVVSRSAQVVALLYPDPDKTKDMTPEEIVDAMYECQKKVNDDMPAYMRVSKIQIRTEEFEKTPKKSIKRYLYE